MEHYFLGNTFLRLPKPTFGHCELHQKRALGALSELPVAHLFQLINKSLLDVRCVIRSKSIQCVETLA